MGIIPMRVDYTYGERIINIYYSSPKIRQRRLCIGKYTHYIIIIIIIKHIVPIRIEEVSVPVYRKRPRQYYTRRRETLAGHDEFRFSKNKNRRRSNIIQNVSYRRFILAMKYMRIYIIHEHDDTYVGTFVCIYFDQVSVDIGV